MVRRTLFSDTIWVALSVVLSSGLSLIMLLLLSNWDKDFVNYFAGINILSAILIAFFKFGSFGYIVSKYPKTLNNVEETRVGNQMIKTAFSFLLIINSIIFIGLMFGNKIVANIILKDTQFQETNLFLPGIAIAFLLTLNNFANSLLNVQMKNTLKGILQIIQSALRYLVPIPFIFLRKFEIILYIFIGVDAITFLIRIYFSRKILLVKGWYPLFTLLKKSMPLYITEIFNYGQTKIDVLLVDLVYGGDPFANYYIIRTIFNVVQQLTLSINTSFLPHMSERFASKDKTIFPKFFKNLTTIFGFSAFLLLMGSLTLAIPIVELFNTEVNIELVIVMSIMFFAIIPRVLWLQVFGCYYAGEILKPIPILNLIFAIVNIGVELLFIFLFGLIGASIAIVLGYIFAFIIFYIYLIKKIDIKINFRNISIQTIGAIILLIPNIFLVIYQFSNIIIYIELVIFQIAIFFNLIINLMKKDISQIILLFPPKYRLFASQFIDLISIKRMKPLM